MPSSEKKVSGKKSLGNDKKSKKSSAFQRRNSDVVKRKFVRPCAFVALFLIGLFAAAALFSFTKNQDFLFKENLLKSFVVSGTPTERNPFGLLGASFSVLLFNLLGIAAFFFPAFLFLFAFYMLRTANSRIFYAWKILLCFVVLFSGAIFLSTIPNEFYADESAGTLNFTPNGSGGGLIGKFLSEIFKGSFGEIGTALIALLIYISALFALIFSSPIKTLKNFFIKIFRKIRERQEAKKLEKMSSFEEREKRRIEATIAIQGERNSANSDFAMGENAPVADEIFAQNGNLGNANEADPLEKIEVDETAISDVGAPVLKNLDEENLVPAEENFDVPAEEIPSEIAVPAEENSVVPEEEKIVPEEKIPAETIKVVNAETLEKADEDDLLTKRGKYIFPPLDLLSVPPPAANQQEDYEARGQEIIRALAEFNCSATMSTAQVGPTITRYEIRPGAGVKAERILNLQNNIAMALRATSARLAPVPENGTIGIEVPNRKMQSVPIRELLESKAWNENKMEIPAVLGKDVTGKPVLIDLAKMPHGLIAGSSGSGKSVCLNGIITSILYHSSPEEVRLVMVDPKVVELRVYNDAPHMLIPVITDMKRAPGALKWLIDEMERRYQLLEEAGVRNIIGFNAKIEKDKAEAQRLALLAANSENTNAFEGAQNSSLGNDEFTKNISVPRDDGVLNEIRGKKRMSYIVCIIDEFADIMAQNAAEIETGVARLTAKARAAGIHLILATQRPDAKTVTGLIKANLGTRIALRVTSGTNSRIILDEVGAETLIGKGDMLVLGPGSPFPQRAQGVWVSEEEIEKVVQFLAEENGKPKYADDVTTAIDNYAAAQEEVPESDDPVDENDEEAMLKKAFDVIFVTKKASISHLQLKMKIGYGRAARLMSELEDRGYVGPQAAAAKSRDILRDRWEG